MVSDKEEKSKIDGDEKIARKEEISLNSAKKSFAPEDAPLEDKSQKSRLQQVKPSGENNLNDLPRPKKMFFKNFIGFGFLFLLVCTVAVMIGCVKLKPVKIEKFYLDSFSFKNGELSTVINLTFESGVPLDFEFRIKTLNVTSNGAVINVRVDKEWRMVKSSGTNRLKFPLALSTEDGINALVAVLNNKSASFNFKGVATYKLGSITKDVKFERNFDVDLSGLIKNTGAIDLLRLFK